MVIQGSTRRQILRGSGIGAAGLIAGCLGTGGGGSEDELHIMTDYTGDAWDKHWNTLTDGFNEQNDISINLEKVGMQGTGGQRLATLMQSGNPPEMFHGTITQIGDLVNIGRTQSVSGVVDDLADEWGEAMFRDTITPIEGETHMIPHGVYAGGTLNYRADLYAELGLEEPETWSELVENVKAIDEAGIETSQGDKVRGFALPAQPAGKPGSDFSNWLYNAGGDVWQPGTENDLELWLDEDHVLAVFDHLNELANYSPDPSGLNWTSTIEDWTLGRLGHCIMNNAWLCGPAIANGLTDLALATEQTLIPKREGADPIQRGWVLADGTPVINGSSNPDTAKDFGRHMYGAEQGVATTLVEPMRFMPPYRGILETDEYQSHEYFQMEDGAFLEKQRYCMDEIAPKLTSEEAVTTPETLHINSMDITSEAVNRLVVSGNDPQDVYDWTISEYESALEDVQSQSNY
ncbi:ABC transporter substrate-binding protein [Natrinema halophilum]|uniref:Extracellular solute-binding protein n=1 Tax=Natrinema halophilum TaxID=1699371 RepID=A0A7D5GJ25_9EURY|nr:extracellular solute-binding protein [Natrinema halophilum]QLG50167.1 extracellular solute-binding protein [Natrinema halophilum]